jgi:hypothetical protein
MIGNLFSKIRRKPKHVKDNIAFASASVVTVAVFLVWVLNVPNELINETKSESEKVQPFTTLFNQIKEQVASVGDSLEEEVPDVASTTANQERLPAQSVIASSTVTATGSTAFVPREVQITTTTNASSTATTTQNIE